MNTAEAYQQYIAVKQHFSDSRYDYFRYLGKVRLSRAAFNSRSDLFYFEKLARHHDSLGLLVAHLVENPSAWIGDIVGDGSPYRQRRRIIESLSRIFEEEAAAIDVNEALRCESFSIPGLIRSYLGGTISLETATIINDLTGASERWKKLRHFNPLIEPICLRLEKYLPFLREMTKGGYSRKKFHVLISKTLDRNKKDIT